MNVKMTKDIQTAFVAFADIAYTTGFENAKLHKHLNSFLTNPIDLSKLTDIQLDIIDKSMCFMAQHMQEGDLNEDHISHIKK
jgi:hypothetical protein